MFVLIAIAIMIFAGIALTYSVESSYYEAFKNRLETGFNNWDLKEEPTKEEILKYFSDFKKDAYFTFGITEYKTFSIVNGKTNEILFSNDKLYEKDRNRLMDEILHSQNYVWALAGKKGDSNKFLHIDSKIYFDYAIKKGDFIFYFRYDKEDWKGTVNEFNRIIQFSLLIAVILSIILGYFLSRTITNPIVDLMHSARKIASGDLGDVLEVRSDDEIGKLTVAFNYMSRELKKTLGEISREKNKIETVLKYMSDGVIAFNSSGEIIHVNLTAKKLLGAKSIVSTFDEFSNKYNLQITLKDITEGQISTNKSIDINISESIIKVLLGFFTDMDKNMEGIICVLHDVTEQKKLEDMQREFVANVSHELKTPLASIKSYTETIIDAELDDETQYKFLNIINSESDRMSRIVRDLLQLSRLDNNSMNWSMQDFDITFLLKDIIEKLRLDAENKKIHLTMDITSDIPKIYGDKHKIGQVLINILSNAIKYTTENGSVDIQAGVLDEYVFVRFKDTGIGIPKESLPRIFERFYRVDKARSREMGGTGLGLSIAKEIVEAHAGTISAASEPDVGTEIMVMLPATKV